MKILNFMKRYGKMPLGISIGGFFFVNKKIFIRMMSGFYSFLSTLIQLNTTNNKKTCHSRQFLNVTLSIRKAAWYINFVWWPCGTAIAYHPRGSGFEPGPTPPFFSEGIRAWPVEPHFSTIRLTPSYVLASL